MEVRVISGQASALSDLRATLVNSKVLKITNGPINVR